MTYVYVQGPASRHPTAGEHEHIDRFVAASSRRRVPHRPGDWRVPGVGYCSFSGLPLLQPVAYQAARKN